MARDPREHPSQRRTRVVVLDHTAELGGAELALVRLLEGLASLGEVADVHVVLFQDGPLVERLRTGGHRVDVVPLATAVAGLGRAAAGSAAGAAAALRTVPFVFRLARHVRRLQPDVIHTTSLKADVLGVLVSRLARRPLVWHVHDRLTDDYLSPRVARVMRALASRAPAAVIANSRATARTIDPTWAPPQPGRDETAAGPQAGRGRITVAHPGLAPAQVREAPRPAPQTRVVGVVGRISPTKDQLTFVRAAGLIAAQHPDVRFRIVGDALFGQEDYAERVRDEMVTAGLSHCIELTCFVDDVAAQLDAMSVCVHTAAVPEPFGQVVAEAMARGVPVVATAGGGVDEILEPLVDGRPLGWLVTPGDPAALAHAVLDALDHPAEADARAHAAWQAVAERFTARITAGAVLEVWRDVTDRR
jgi:glycosyltransferase involved in cell wall biosynthesis